MKNAMPVVKNQISSAGGSVKTATKKQVTEPNASLALAQPAMPNRLTDAVIPAPTVGLWVPKTPTAVVNVPKKLAPVMQISLP